jgi:hypothetical protein
MVVSLGWVLPWFVCGWLPETLVLIPFDLQLHPAVEIIRYSVLPVVWQTALVALGLHKTHGIGWPYTALTGLAGNGIMFVMFFAFLR